MFVTIDDSCARKTAIRRWISEIIAMVGSSECPFPDAMKQRFVLNLPNITIRCEDCEQGLVGHTGGTRVTLCNGSLTKRTTFHELIHAMGGRELDAEAIEAHCIGAETAPAGDDWDKFVRDSERVDGKLVSDFVIYDPCTGDVWVNAGTRNNPVRGEPLEGLPEMPDRKKREWNIDCGGEKKKKTEKRKRKRR